MNSLTVGKLSRIFYTNVPINTFSKLFLNKYQNFTIINKDYLMERHHPIIINENLYSQNIYKTDGFDLITSSYKENLSNVLPIYDISLSFHKNDYVVLENLSFNNKDYNYYLYMLNPNKNKFVYKKENCTSKLIYENDVPTQIQNYYEEIRKIINY